LLEPVDREYCPTPPGEASHTVLLSNLGNRVQPVIRYDLGDSMTVNPEPCPCGNPLPAIRVEGRRDDVLSMRAPNGSFVRLLPLALTTVVEEAAHPHRFQIVQNSLRPDQCFASSSAEMTIDMRWDAQRQMHCGAISRQQSLANVQVARDRRSPVTDRRSGKLREVMVAMERGPAHA
jgi:phenylacetate-coenzyme A ligase PaaK-like adenylate-forming protein